MRVKNLKIKMEQNTEGEQDKGARGFVLDKLQANPFPSLLFFCPLLQIDIAFQCYTPISKQVTKNIQMSYLEAYSRSEH